MRFEYERPSVTVSHFEAEDVVTTSSAFGSLVDEAEVDFAQWYTD